MRRPLFVAITGDIASGKSLVTAFYRKIGLPVYSADEIVHKLLKDINIIKDLKKLIQGDFIDKNKQIDRKKLRQIVFNDKDKLNTLNSYLHPKVIDTIADVMKSYEHTAKERFVFFEIPLLFECRLQDAFDVTVLIRADEDIKLQRIVERDKCSPETAKAILDNQMPEIEKWTFADIPIYNNHDIDILEMQLETLYQSLKLIKKRKRKSLISPPVEE